MHHSWQFMYIPPFTEDLLSHKSNTLKKEWLSFPIPLMAIVIPCSMHLLLTLGYLHPSKEDVLCSWRQELNVWGDSQVAPPGAFKPHFRVFLMKMTLGWEKMNEVEICAMVHQ